MRDELFPGSQQILDYYHLAENIYGFGKHIFSNDEKKYTPWAESLPYLLKNGRTDEAMESPRGSVHADTPRPTARGACISFGDVLYWAKDARLAGGKF
jgi:hypothetical protein